MAASRVGRHRADLSAMTGRAIAQAPGTLARPVALVCGPVALVCGPVAVRASTRRIFSPLRAGLPGVALFQATDIDRANGSGRFDAGVAAEAAGLSAASMRSGQRPGPGRGRPAATIGTDASIARRRWWAKAGALPGSGAGSPAGRSPRLLRLNDQGVVTRARSCATVLRSLPRGREGRIRARISASGRLPVLSSLSRGSQRPENRTPRPGVRDGV